VVRDAWQRSQALTVYGWIYGLSDGLLKDLGLAAASWGELETQAAAAVARR
jgi:carbonic anhydrase